VFSLKREKGDMPTSIVTTLIDRQQIADDTLEFSLARPDGFEFQAGQHINVKLTELLFEDKKAGRRMFTIASAPSEEKLRIATRLTDSGFKKTLAEGPKQDVEIIGPRGDMLRDETRPAVFMAGGVGITPFRSLLKEALDKNLPQPITLFYSNRSVETAAYHDFFTQAAHEHADVFTYVPTITGATPENWTGETTRIDAELIKKYVDDWSAVTFYVCGPPNMVTAMTDILKVEGVDQARILSESFWGY
jgi:ferredoxin-NADP reductase